MAIMGRASDVGIELPNVHARAAYSRDDSTKNNCIGGGSRPTNGTANLEEKDRSNVEPFDLESLKKLANKENDGD